MNKFLILTIITAIWVSLCFYWFDYKIFLIIFFAMWGSNIERIKKK